MASKVSAAMQGYFQDDFIQHFVCKVTRRTPLINRSAEIFAMVLLNIQGIVLASASVVKNTTHFRLDGIIVMSAEG